MTQRQRAPEQIDRDSVEENTEPGAPEESKTPMGRFKALTRRVVGVTREQLQAEQERYDAAKTDSPRPRRSKPP